MYVFDDVIKNLDLIKIDFSMVKKSYLFLDLKLIIEKKVLCNNPVDELRWAYCKLMDFQKLLN